MRIPVSMSLCWILVWLFTNSVSAQSAIRSNDPVKGRIAKAKEIHAWEVEVGDRGEIHFEVECDTGALYAQVIRVDDNQPMALDPIQGTNASHFNGGKFVVKFNNAAMPRRGPFSARTADKLVAGKYRIVVGSPGQGELGPYELTVVAPKFRTAVAAPRDAGPPPGAGARVVLNAPPADGGNPFVEILAELRKLNERVERLEKRLEEK